MRSSPKAAPTRLAATISCIPLISLSALSALISLSPLSYARILNVPEDFETIQSGIDASEDGDTVLVSPGIYYESISFEGKAILVASFSLLIGDASYADSTIIDGQNGHSVVRFINEEDENSILIGFTIQNGLGNFDDQDTRCGGGLFIRGASPRLRDLKIIENYAWYGGGVLIQLNAEPIFEDCRIFGNSSDRYGGSAIHCSRRSKGRFFGSVISNNYAGQVVAITCVSSSTLEFTNCTITRNTTSDGYPSRISTLNNANHIFLVNSIVENSIISVGYGGTNDTLLVSYCDIIGGRDSTVILREESRSDVLWLDGNLDADPLFLDPDNGDYHLTADSPCIDSGDPDSPPDPDGTRADMGAFYFHQRDIEVDPLDIVFNPTAWEEVDSQAVAISNLGGNDLHLTQLFVQEFPPSYVSFRESWSPDEPKTILPDSTYYWWLYFRPWQAGEEEGRQPFASLVIFCDDPDEPEVGVSASGEILSIPSDILHSSLFTLHSAFPNPFNSTTTIRFSTGAIIRDATSLRVYGLDGRLVADLSPLLVPAPAVIHSENKVVWNAEGVPGGIYLVSLESGVEYRTMKVVLMR